MLSLESHRQVRHAIQVSYEISMAVLALQVIQAIFGSGKTHSINHTLESLIPYLELSQEDLMQMIDVVLDQDVELHFDSEICMGIVLEKYLPFGDKMPCQFSWQCFGPAERDTMLRWRDDMRRQGCWPESSRGVLHGQMSTPERQVLRFLVQQGLNI